MQSKHFSMGIIKYSNQIFQLLLRLEELKKLKQQGEKTQSILDEYDAWLRDNSSRMKQLMREGATTASHAQEFKDWCEHVARMDEAVAKISTDNAKDSKIDNNSGTVAPENLKNRINDIKVVGKLFIGILLQQNQGFGPKFKLLMLVNFMSTLLTVLARVCPIQARSPSIYVSK